MAPTNDWTVRYKYPLLLQEKGNHNFTHTFCFHLHLNTILIVTLKLGYKDHSQCPCNEANGCFLCRSKPRVAEWRTQRVDPGLTPSHGNKNFNPPPILFNFQHTKIKPLTPLLLTVQIIDVLWCITVIRERNRGYIEPYDEREVKISNYLKNRRCISTRLRAITMQPSSSSLLLH